MLGSTESAGTASGHEPMPSVPRGPRVFTDDNLATIRRMVELGASRQQIAEAIGTTVSSLKTTCVRLRISLRRPAFRTAFTFQPEKPVKLFIEPDVRQLLAEEAKARGMALTELCGNLLATIAGDGLVRAILDTST